MVEWNIIICAAAFFFNSTLSSNLPFFLLLYQTDLFVCFSQIFREIHSYIKHVYLVSFASTEKSILQSKKKLDEKQTNRWHDI